MEVELICPTWSKKTEKKRAKRARVFKIPPLGLLNVAAITPEDVKVTLTDENVEVIDFDRKKDLVGITVMTSAAPRAYEIADIFRKKGVPVVLGGPHVSALPDEAIKYADSVVIGEAEGAWKRLIDDFKRYGRKGLKKFYKNEEKPDLSEVPFPRWDLLKKEKYIVTKVLHATRGCPYNCSFCSVTKLFGRKIRKRPVEKIVECVEKNVGKSLKDRFFVFLDDNIMGDRVYAKELFKALVPYKLIWMSQASVNAAYDEELLALAAKSGCKALFVGFETILPQALKEIGKHQNKIEFYLEAIKRFHRYGIFVEGAFIFGFDSDTKDVFEETVRFVNKAKLDGVQYTILTPLPGTAFYEKIEREKRFIDRDWSNYDCGHAVFKPKNMTPEELQAGLSWAYKKTYSLISIFTRLTGILSGGRWRYAVPLLIFNLGYRKTCRRMAERAWNPSKIHPKIYK